MNLPVFGKARVNDTEADAVAQSWAVLAVVPPPGPQGRNRVKPKNHDPLDGEQDRPRKVVIWFGRNRRLAKGFEKTIESAEAWLLITSIQLLIPTCIDQNP